jgi:hypothetical protein
MTELINNQMSILIRLRPKHIMLFLLHTSWKPDTLLTLVIWAFDAVSSRQILYIKTGSPSLPSSANLPQLIYHHHLISVSPPDKSSTHSQLPRFLYFAKLRVSSVVGDRN